MKEGARGDEEREDVSWLLGAGGSPPIIAARRAGSVLFYTYIPEILTRNKVSVTFFLAPIHIPNIQIIDLQSY